ncbi:MAG: hypothetical protein WCG80_15585 [Spirochaetales bacterium]
MKRTELVLLVLVTAISLLAFSCVMPGSVVTRSLAVHLTLPSTFVSPRFVATDLASWTVTGLGPESSSFEQILASDQTTAHIPGLTEGDWTITVSGFDSQNGIVLTGTAVATLVADATNDVSITVAPANPLSVTIDFGFPTAPAISVTNSSDGSDLPVLNQIVTFDPSAHTTISLNASSGLESYEWYFDGVWQAQLSGQAQCVLWGTGASSLPSTTVKILIVVSKDGLTYSQDLWVTDLRGPQ